MQNDSLTKAKEPYTNPETTAIALVPKNNVLNYISNPGGTVPSLDPEEG